MYLVKIQNLSDQNRSWAARFPTEAEALAWLEKQKTKEGRRPLRSISIRNADTGEDETIELPAEATYEIEDLSQNAAYMNSQAIQSRKREYPSFEEFMDIYFDKGLESAEMQALKQKRLEIKQKYPKV